MLKSILAILFLLIFVNINYSQNSNPYNSGEGDYLIITPDQFTSTIIPFAEWKMQKGHKVRIVKKSEISAAGFDWIADNVQDDTYVGIDGFIKQAYDEWMIYKPRFILLVGNVTHLPTHMIVNYPSGSNKIPADMNYGCVNSSNDPDSSKFQNLYFPEIAVGRFSISNQSELTNIISNSIMFERDPISASGTNYFNTIVFSADQNEARFRERSENLRNRINSVPNGPLTKTVYTGKTNDLINTINSGAIILNHYGHGNSPVWINPHFTNNQITSLQNEGMLPIVWSLSCLTGNLMFYSSDDCLAEKFLKNNNKTGAVAVIAPSLESGSDQLLLWERFYESLWPSISFPNYLTGIELPNYYIGNALIHAKIGAYKYMERYYHNSGQTFPPAWYSGPYDGITLAFNEYNLFGDPALEIWTEKPKQFTNISIIDSGDYILVNTGELDCTITVSSDFDYGKNFFETKKCVSSAIFQTNKLPVTITIKKHNFKPFIKKSYETILIPLPERNNILLGMPASTPDILALAKNTVVTWSKENGYDGVEKYLLSSTNGRVTWKPFNSSWQINGTSSAKVIYNLRCYKNNLPASSSYQISTLELDNQGSKGINIKDYNLLQNFPNPFNPVTSIRFSIPVSSFVILKVFDILGNEITTLIEKKLSSGTHEVDFDAKNLKSGVYIFRLQTPSFDESRKMILLR